MMPVPMPEPDQDSLQQFCDPTDPGDSDLYEELIMTREKVVDDDNDLEVAEDEIEAWMCPKRAKQKELILLSQYRRCGKFEKSINHHWVIREKQADKIKRQHLAIKQLRHLLKLNRKSCNDILEMTITSTKH